MQNIDNGIANDISITAALPQNIYCLSANEDYTIKQLLPGESQLIEYALIANNKFDNDAIEIQYDLNESLNKYSKDTLLKLALNKPISGKKLVFKSDEGDKKKEIEIKSLSSDIDKNIPATNYSNPNRLVLIVGNEDYSGNLNAEINVDFAINDANVFKEYMQKILGVIPENTFLLTNATAGEMRKYIELICKLSDKLGNSSEIVFYYAGHGLPDPQTKSPYLIPVDVDATNIDAAIKLEDVYSRFSSSSAKRITVFLDACFSGGGRNQGLLAARSVKIKPKQEQVKGNIVVFSASSEAQESLPYAKEKHGMFTYFLLKELKDNKGNLTYGDLSKSLIRNVSVESLRVNNKEQDPEVNVSHSIIDEWRNWKFME